MKALHIPQNPPHSKPFSFPSNAPSPSHLTYSTGLPRPTFPIPALHATHSALLRYRPASPATDLSSQVQYLVLVFTTSPTRGELTWQETLDPSRFSADGSKGPIPCHDVVGQITAVHAPSSAQSTPKFEVGDVVFGLIDFDRDGAAADEVVVYENEIAKVPRIPDRTGGKAEELLATIPLAGLTAWQALFEYGSIDPPRQEESGEGAARTKRILITGASGAVGLLASQLAAAVRSERQRVHITAVCSSLHAAPIKRLGVDIVACYDVGNEVEVAIEKQGPFDLFIDLTGGPLVTKTLALHTSGGSKLLKSDGGVVSVATFPSDTFFGSLGLGDADVSDLRSRYRFFIVRPDAGQLEQIATLMQKGRLVGFVDDEVHSLDRGKEALEACEAKGRKRLGKVVIRVAEDQHRQL